MSGHKWNHLFSCQRIKEADRFAHFLSGIAASLVRSYSISSLLKHRMRTGIHICIRHAYKPQESKPNKLNIGCLSLEQSNAWFFFFSNDCNHYFFTNMVYVHIFQGNEMCQPRNHRLGSCWILKITITTEVIGYLISL